MHTDFAVLTGSHHTAKATACQDFCFAGTEGLRSWAVVADGCSTGGQTDLGARAWALAARRVVRDAPYLLEDLGRLQFHLHAYAETFLGAMEFDDAFSTLVTLDALGSRVRVNFFGDGALLVRKNDGTQVLINLQFTGNAPRYLNYLRRPELLEQWKAEYASQELLVTTNTYDEAGELVGLKTATFPADAFGWEWTAHVEQDDLEMVLISTDGVSSREAGFVDTARALLAVKSPTGEFLRRRVSKLAREWQAARAMPSDDLAVAGIWLGAGN